MALIIVAYLGLLIALTLPSVTFLVGIWSPVIVSSAWWISLGITLVLAITLVRQRAHEHESDSYAWHVLNLRRVLLMVAIGGLLATMSFFLYYEQFRLRFEIAGPLRWLSIGFWLASMLLLLYGAYRSIEDLLEQRDVAVDEF